MTCKSTEQLFRINKKYWRKNQHQGAHTLSTRVGGAPLPPGRAPYLVGPLVALRRQLQLHILVFGEKKSERKFHRVLRYGAVAKP